MGSRHRAGTRKLCRGAQHDDCQRHRAEYRRCPRCRLEPGHLGNYLLCRGRGHHGAPDGVVGRALWRGEALLHLCLALWRVLAPLRHVHLAWHAAWHAGAAGYGRWASSGASQTLLLRIFPRSSPCRPWDFGHDDAARARGRTGAADGCATTTPGPGILYQRADGAPSA